jgi:hypothetical protein
LFRLGRLGRLGREWVVLGMRVEKYLNGYYVSDFYQCKRDKYAKIAG